MPSQVIPQKPTGPAGPGSVSCPGHHLSGTQALPGRPLSYHWLLPIEMHLTSAPQLPHSPKMLPGAVASALWWPHLRGRKSQKKGLSGAPLSGAIRGLSLSPPRARLRAV